MNIFSFFNCNNLHKNAITYPKLNNKSNAKSIKHCNLFFQKQHNIVQEARRINISNPADGFEILYLLIQ